MRDASRRWAPRWHASSCSGFLATPSLLCGCGCGCGCGYVQSGLQHEPNASGAPSGVQQRRCSQSGGKVVLWSQDGIRQHTHSNPGSAGTEQPPSGKAPGGGRGGGGGGGGGGDGGRMVKRLGGAVLPAVLEPAQFEGVP